MSNTAGNGVSLNVIDRVVSLVICTVRISLATVLPLNPADSLITCDLSSSESLMSNLIYKTVYIPRENRSGFYSSRTRGICFCSSKSASYEQNQIPAQYSNAGAGSSVK